MPSQTKPSSLRNLTEGNPLKKLVLFALPLVASNILMPFYGLIESVITGNFIGSDALASIGVGFPILMLFHAISFGFATGSEIVIAQMFGAKNTEGLKKVGNTVFFISLLLGATLAIIGSLAAEPLLKLLGTPSNIIGNSVSYLRIYFIGMIFSVTYMTGSGVLRGMGDSRWPLLFFICSSVLNIVLDILFVMLFGWSVKGIALATILSQLTSASLFFLRINSGKYEIRLRFRALRFDPGSAKIIVKLALPNSLQQLAVSCSGLIIQFFSNSFGSDFISASSIIMRTDNMVIMPLFAFGAAMSTFTGQNVGAGKIDRVRHGIRSGAFTAGGLGLVLGVLMFFIGPHMIPLFTDNAAVIEIGVRGIHIVALTYFFTAIDNCIAGAMRGAGAPIVPMINSIVANLVRIPVAYFLAIVPGNYLGIYYALLSMVLTSFVMILGYYLSGRWKNRAVVHAPGPEPATAAASAEPEKSKP